MEILGNELGAKKGKQGQREYYCEKCDFKCCKKYSWERHVNTAKHNQETIGNDLGEKKGEKEQMYLCENCNKSYNTSSGLWKHNQKCVKEKDNNSNNIQCENTNVSDKELIMMLIKQNSELLEVIKNGTHNNNNNTHTNSHNKSFNLNFFLNETCKDALNIQDFVSSIKPSIDDLENTGRRGYIEGISNIILKGLNNLEQHFRPIHCSDQKREILYIKDDNQWIKESDDKPILKKAIKTIANENIKKIKEWRDSNPDCTDSDSKKNSLYLKIVSNSMNGTTEEESSKNISKIISNVVKETIIQKDPVGDSP
jgi:hypothetical protein